MHAAEGSADGLTTSQIAWRWSPLFFTHINQALLTTLPFTVAVYMVRDFEAARGDEPSEAAVGRATGMLAAVFCAAQLVTQLPWGLVSDRIGRKPVLVVGNISCVASVLLFGLSNSYAQAMAARAVGGALNAVILVEKSMIGEGLPTKDAQAKAFGLLSLCWGLGSLAGPMVGGALSAPCGSALRVEALCGGGALLAARPYFLPCFLAALLSGAATLMTIFGLEETLPSRRHTAAGSGGGGKYAAVPSGDAGDGGSRQQPARREVELGGVFERRDGSIGSGNGGAPPGKGDGSPSLLRGSKPASFRGDSARSHARSGSPRLAAVRPSLEHARDGGSALSRGNSQGSSSDLEVVVLEPADLERGVGGRAEEQQQQQQQQRGEQQEGEGHRLLPGGSHQPPGRQHAAAEGDTPWYRQRTVVRSLLGYGLIAFMYNMLDEVVPIFASAAVAEGGLGFAPSQLAPSLSFGGFVLVLWALKGFPWLLRKLGVVRALRLGLWQTAPVALLPPCASLFGGALGPSQVLLFAAMGLKAVTATNAFTACLILVNAAAPRHALGAVNGAGQSLASLVRALGPALGGLSWGLSSSLAARPWWPAWLPHQFVPFAGATAVALLTDAVYWGLRLPEEGPPPAR